MNRFIPMYPDSFLEPENMIKLYALGAFPMAEDKESSVINWYMPEIRTIIPLKKSNTPRSLRTFMKRSVFDIRYDFDPRSVILGCRERDESWISPKLIEAYLKLCEMGYLHSVEVYNEDELIGGLYGISYRGAFFGESMFSKKPQTSKVALVHLINHLNDKGFMLLDVQYQTSHLEMFGAIQIPMDEYNHLLREAYKLSISF